jgi:hypothetical protein
MSRFVTNEIFEVLSVTLCLTLSLAFQQCRLFLGPTLNLEHRWNCQKLNHMNS